MALVSCRECAEEVSSRAPTCPKCGIKNPGSSGIAKKMLIGMCGVFIFIMLIGLGAKDNSQPASTVHDKALPNIGTETTLLKDVIACKDEETFKKLTELAIQKDDEAYKEVVSAGIFTGNCIVLGKTKKVFVSDVSVFHGITKIRPKGSASEYWVFTGAVAVN